MKRLVILAAFLAACATGGGAPRPHTPQKDYRVVTAVELQREGGNSLGQALERLRPQYFHGARAITGAWEGMFWHDLSDVFLIPASDIAFVKFLDASETTVYHGVTHGGPTIEITIRNR